MQQYYNPNRSTNLFNQNSKQPFKISRSKIELFLSCPKCFYLDRKLGISQPPGFPFNLNSAVDLLLKKEFDIHRTNNTTHPLMRAYNLDLIPFNHKNMVDWRNNFIGVQHLHTKTNFIVSGAVDDIWIDKHKNIYVVDYKSTSKEGDININANWQISYKRQIEIYQWLLRKNKFSVSDIGYFVYCNGKRDKEAFDGKLEFDIKIIPYQGNDSWMEKTLIDIRDCLTSQQAPNASSECQYCNYTNARRKAETS